MFTKIFCCEFILITYFFAFSLVDFYPIIMALNSKKKILILTVHRKISNKVKFFHLLTLIENILFIEYFNENVSGNKV